MLTKVEAIIRQERLPMVRAALEELGVMAITITQVVGHGAQKGVVHQWKGASYRTDLLPKVKIEMVVETTPVDAVITAIEEAARTGQVGDGKIFVSEISDAIRIRTGERGSGAV